MFSLQKGTRRGIGLIEAFILAALVIFIVVPLTLWAIHVAIDIVMLAVKLGIACFLLLIVVYAIKNVSKKV